MKMNARSAIRRRAGLTQLQLSRLTKISPPRISLWDNGEVELRSEELQRIAEVLAEHLSAVPIVTEKQALLEALTAGSA
jgi:transcriptional regulator with XRE-family HTH domain